jgi:hypothetical protein
MIWRLDDRSRAHTEIRFYAVLEITVERTYRNIHQRLFRDFSVSVLIDLPDLLVVGSDWNKHSAWRSKLIDQGSWHSRSCCSDVNCIVRAYDAIVSW